MFGCRVIACEQTKLVFGLEWVPLLGETASSAQALSGRGVVHSVVSGQPAGAMGYAYGLDKRAKYWSGAELLARCYPDSTVACLLQFDEQSWHVLASHNGVALVRADRSYADQAQAQEALGALCQVYPQMRVLDASGLVAARAGMLQQLAEAAAQAAPMQLVRNSRKTLVIALVFLVLLALSWFLLAARAPQAPLADAQALWHEALQRQLAQQPVYGAAGTRALLQALYTQPVQIAGWRLHELHCNSARLGAPWRCTSDYRRADIQADNRGLARAAPTNWRLDFPSFDVARAVWPLELPAQPANLDELPAAPVLAREWSSELQAILPAFAVLRLEEPRALALSAPRDGAGRELAAPSDFPAIALRRLKLQGPLRSAALVVALSEAVSWQKLVLSVAPAARADVRTSSLTIQMEGLVYERKS